MKKVPHFCFDANLLFNPFKREELVRVIGNFSLLKFFITIRTLIGSIQNSSCSISSQQNKRERGKRAGGGGTNTGNGKHEGIERGRMGIGVMEGKKERNKRGEERGSKARAKSIFVSLQRQFL